MKIFVCGGSAVGKTTFVEKIAEKYNLKQDDEIIRNFPIDWFKDYSLMHRETLFLLGQVLKEQKKENGVAIYDRSLIDVVAWMVDSHDDLLYQFIADNFVNKDGLYIITPPETEEWVGDNLKEYTEDKIRWTCLTSKLADFYNNNLKRYKSINAFISDYICFMSFERYVMENILEKSKAKYYVCKDLKDYRWQKEAEKEILKYLGKECII